MIRKLIAGTMLAMLLTASAGLDAKAQQVQDPEDAGPVVTVQEEADVSEEEAPTEEQTPDEDADAADPEEETDAEEADVPGADSNPGTYTVTYKPNGGTGDEFSETANNGEEYEIFGLEPGQQIFTRTGYNFKEWNADPNGDGESYQPGDTVIDLAAAGENIDIYAIWDLIEYDIEYHLDDGTNDPANPDKYDVEKLPITFKDPVKKGYRFDGWFTDEAFTSRIYKIAAGTTGKLDVYARFTPITYTVRFNGNGSTGGSMSDMTGCEYDAFYNLTANAFTRKGYAFAGWNTKSDGSGTNYADRASFKNLTDMASIVTLYARWNLLSYSITYKLNGGKNDSANPKTYTVNTATIKLKNATRKGYTFAGWYSDPKYNNRVTKISKGSTGDKTLYAKWTANTYTVKLDGHGATKGKMSDIKNRKYGKTYKLPANKYKRKGYSFNGWNTKKSGKGKAYRNKAKYSNLTAKDKGVVTLYAQWNLKTYKIKYVLNGGKNNKANPTSYTVKTKKITLKAPTRKGYTFAGWYKEKSFKHKVKYIPKGSTGNKTFYAKWTPIEYTIRFNRNGADDGHMDDMLKCRYDKVYKLKKNNYKKDGYAFTGWNTKKDGSGTSYSNRQRVKNLRWKNGAVITLYAQWRPIEYTIVFDGNGSTSGSMTDMSCTYGKIYKLRKNAYEKRRFVFDCWNTKKDGTGKSYKDRDEVSNLTKKDGDRVVLYAQWDEDYEEISMNVSKPSQDDISDYINDHPYYSTDTYYRVPSLREPYSEGQMSDRSLDGCLNQVKTYRYIAGLPTNIYNSDTYCDRASKGTLLCQLNGTMSHDPSRPYGLYDPKYDQLYADGKEGCRKSILADGYPTMWMKDAISMWMKDSGDDNIEDLGNRRYLLYPYLSAVGFGRTGGNNGGYCAAYVMNDDMETESSTRAAWPANNTPTGLFDEDTAWSLSLGRSIDRDDVKVKVIRDKDHKEWLFNSDHRDGRFYVSNASYGVKGCIIFRPDDIDVDDDASYTVKIFLKDRKEMIKYKVKFFDL